MCLMNSLKWSVLGEPAAMSCVASEAEAPSFVRRRFIKKDVDTFHLITIPVQASRIGEAALSDMVYSTDSQDYLRSYDEG